MFRDYAHTTASTLALRDGIAFDDWLGVGCQLARLSNGSSWWLGDWLLYGERAYGKRYRSALEATRLDYQTLRNYAWVARRFGPPRRRTELSFQHHAEVAALPEADQDLWLDRTERCRWSRNELRRRLRVEHRHALPAAESEPTTLRVPLTTERERRWRQAAEAVDRRLVDWITVTADEAAEAALADEAAEHSARPRQLSVAAGPPSSGARSLLTTSQ